MGLSKTIVIGWVTSFDWSIKNQIWFSFLVKEGLWFNEAETDDYACTRVSNCMIRDADQVCMAWFLICEIEFAGQVKFESGSNKVDAISWNIDTMLTW